MPDLSEGAVFAGHRIEGVAAHGGMGVVYRAVHLALNRRVALKVLAAELAGSAGFRARFREESEIAASLDHPHVIPIYNAGEEGGSLYVTMRFVHGTDLRELAAGAPLEPPRAAAVVAQAAEALDAAHARGLVHRDVKPGNVLIEERGGRDHVYLTDFGLAKEISSDPGLTETGNWVGTVDYAAPEQIRGKAVDARADVYALGGVLYWALTARVPYPRDNDLAKMYAHLNDPVPALGAEVPAALAAVIRRAMAKDPAERFPSAGDLGRAALAAVEGHSPSGPERSVAAGAAAAPPDQASVASPPDPARASAPPDPARASAPPDPAGVSAPPDPAGDPTRRLPVAPAPPSAIREPGSAPESPAPREPPPAGQPASTRVHPAPPGDAPGTGRSPLQPGARGRRGRAVAAGVLGIALPIAVLAIAGVFSNGAGGGGAGSGARATPRRDTPTATEAGRVLQAYANRYGREDAAGLGELFASDMVRRNDGDPPENRTQAIAAYRRQFAQLSNPSYRLSGLRMDAKPGAARVTGRYTISSDSGSTSGTVVFDLVERGGRLSIRRLEITPG